MSTGYGFCDGTNQRCIAVASEDNAARGDSARIQRNDAVICTLNPSGTIETVDSVAAFSQWLTDGIQINWTDAPAAQFYLTVTLIGGNDVSDIAIGSLLTTTGASATLSSLSWQPENGLFLSIGSTTENSPVVSAISCVGAYDGTTQWTQGYLSQDNPAAMLTRQNYRHDRVMDIPTTAGATDGYSTIAWTSTGFTLTNTDTYSASFPVYYLVWKGGTCTVGYATEPAGTGQQTITTNEDVQAVMVFGVDSGTAGWQAGAMWTSGMATSTTERYVNVFEDTTAVADSIVVSRHDTDQLYLNITSNVTATSSTLDDEATFYSKSATNFLIDWTNIGQARPFRYITFGTGAAINPVSISENAVSIGAGSATGVLSAIRTISDTPVVSVSDSLVGAKTFTVSISETAVTVGAEEVEAEREVDRDIDNETVVTVGADTVETTETYTKPISEDSVTIGTDSIAIEADYTRPISESSVTVGAESIEGTKIPSGPTAKLYDVHFVEFPEDITDSVTAETGGVTSLHTHKYDILQKIEATKTHKYNLLEAIEETTKTHKYDILEAIETTKTHKYNVLEAVSTTKTHLYNLIEQIEATKTHLYNVVRTVSTTTVHLYNVIGKVLLPARTHKYDVLNTVSTSKTHKYDVLEQIDTTTTHKYNLIEQIEANKTHKYDVEQAQGTVSTTKTHKYHLEGKVTTTKTHLYNLLNSVTTTKTHKYHVIEAIEATKTHKYDVIGKVQVTKTHLYNVVRTVSTTKVHLYHVIKQITATKTHKYNVQEAISQVSTTKTHKYNVIAKITATKTHKYNVLEASSQVTTNTTHIYNVLAASTRTITHKYNIIVSATTTKTHKFDITASIARIVTHKFNIIQKIITTKTHLYNLVNRVTPDTTKTHKYNILQKIQRTRTHKYNSIGRLYTTRTHRYDQGGKIVVTKRHKYDVGSALGLQELGGSTQAFIKFPERVRIIDIIADLNNTAIANVEIPVARPPANIATAVIAIAEYSSKILTASAYRPRHRIASQLIIPQVIDTIENRAIAPYIGIEALEPSEESRIQALSQLQIVAYGQNCRIASHTQIKTDEKTKIKIASSTTMLQQTPITRVASKAQLEMIPFLRPIMAPEIMTTGQYRALKTLINLLQSDVLFE